MKKISVIIPTYNSWQTLKECISSVQNQTQRVFEIIIVDNASTDETSKNILKYFPKVKLVRLQKNSGVTGGRNAGIKAAFKNTDYLFFFDHDMVADFKMIDELLKVIELSEDIGIVTPKIYYWGDKQSLRDKSLKKRIWSAGTGINLWTGQVLFRGGIDQGQYDQVAEVQVAPAAILIKRGVLKQIKEFDDRYFAVYEDTDFCFRVKKAGFKTFYSPQAIAYHKIPLDSKKESDRLLTRSYWIGRNRVIFMRDFGRSFTIFLLFIPIFTLYYFLLSLRYSKIKYFLDFLKGTIRGLLS